MKLFTRYLRINLFATLVIFLLASIAFYFLLWYVTIGQVDEDLKIEQREIASYVNKYHRPPEPINVKDQNMSFETSHENRLTRKFNTIQSPSKTDKEDFREISFLFTLPINNEKFFPVSKSLERTQIMNQSIIISIITIVVILAAKVF